MIAGSLKNRCRIMTGALVHKAPRSLSRTTVGKT